MKLYINLNLLSLLVLGQQFNSQDEGCAKSCSGVALCHRTCILTGQFVKENQEKIASCNCSDGQCYSKCVSKLSGLSENQLGLIDNLTAKQKPCLSSSGTQGQQCVAQCKLIRSGKKECAENCAKSTIGQLMACISVSTGLTWKKWEKLRAVPIAV
ncbi:hypothetical protein CONCODRAFT_8141 [Conidiobolus coronatus NRRL 28638]|uniref:Extracellular membrane protein CFEM domain-containing protein n=1 Tax=Conidiobolus coronatus (strain ATCC 28846 / CBS 209.66 / NRRL 28638) TaxID=796925 RepID=A0A137P3H9_CONC2|nr:hypothetical protein CONCODRAFT_8141 [Conidiobolus coronatus NRRL 28638]|eukprot:KXN69454.1 hypothetical protein CONCODRAFT_8141 [Conidiobolus coronatus NRRL 28638]